MLIAKRFGIHIDQGCSNITLDNCTRIHRLPDAFVLCTTEQFNPENLSGTFGNYCVEINQPQKFFKLVTENLIKHHSVRESAFGRVIYSERRFTGLQNPPGPIGFVKPPDMYGSQHEFRFLWTTVTNTRLTTFELHVPGSELLCRRIA